MTISGQIKQDFIWPTDTALPTNDYFMGNIMQGEKATKQEKWLWPEPHKPSLVAPQ